MFDIGGLELLLVAAMALIVVGPKELPVMVRNVGRWVSKARSLAREFQQGMEDAAKEADIDEFRQIGSMKKDLERQAKDIGRGAQKMMDDATERMEPDFDDDFSSRPSKTPARAQGSRYAERPTGRDGGRDERSGDKNDPLDQFQRGMRQGD